MTDREKITEALAMIDQLRSDLSEVMVNGGSFLATDRISGALISLRTARLKLSDALALRLAGDTPRSKRFLGVDRGARRG